MSIYDLLKSFLRQRKEADFWDRFTDEQKKELELAWEESEHEVNLADNNIVISQARKVVAEGGKRKAVSSLPDPRPTG